MSDNCPTCGKPKTQIAIVPNPSVPFGGLVPQVNLYPADYIDACETCDREKFKETMPNVHAFLNRDQLSPEERAYRFGFQFKDS